MAKLKSENAISDDLETSKFQNSLPECKHIKVGPEVFTPLQNILECVPLTQNILTSSPPKETQSSSENKD